MARGRGEVHGFTVPAINLRAQTFDMARTVFETALAADVGAVIFEIARSEQTYTWQRPAEFIASVLAGAIAAGWSGPVFVQGDHYQFNAAKYKADPEKMTEEIRGACRQAMAVGYRNIDIDSSTLVDLSQPNVDLEQQRQLPPGRRADRPDPRAGARRGSRSASAARSARSASRTRPSPSCGPTSTATGASSTAAGPAPSGSARSASRPARATAASRSRTARVAAVKLDFEVLRRPRRGRPERTAWPAASSTARARSRTSSSTTSRRSRRPRSTSRPASRTLLYEHPGVPGRAPPGDRRLVLRQRRSTSASRTRPTSSSSTRRRKKAIGPFKRQLWDLADPGRDPGRPAAQDRVPVRRAPGGRLGGDDRALHPPGRGAPPAARGARRRSRRLTRIA